MDSLRTRLIVTVAIVLMVFLGLAGVALDRAFRGSVDAGVRQSLEARVYLLLGAAEIDATGAVRMPAAPPEPRLGTPDSGLYAAIRDGAGRLLWHSESSTGRAIDYPAAGSPGPAYARVPSDADGTLRVLVYPVTWELEDGGTRRFEFLVATGAAAAEARLAGFRRALWGWFAGIAGILLAVQTLGLRWGLRPLRRAADEVAAIEAGERDRLGAGYPRELRPLTDNLNALLAGSAARLQRQRDALADLAHSLKTPLAVLRSVAEGGPADAAAATVREQAERMDTAVAWHLQRAAAAGPAGLIRPVPLAATVRRVTGSLAKVHSGRVVTLSCAIDANTVFLGDPADLMEILGNLLDNAWKWCTGRVRVSAGAGEPGWLRLEIADDGPGIPPAERDAVVERGVRGDERVPGEGIGLDIVRRMVVEAYGGSLRLGSAPEGGLLVTVGLPGRTGRSLSAPGDGRAN